MQSTSEVSYWSPRHVIVLNLDNEVQDWNKKLCQLTSQTDDLSAELKATSSECQHLNAKIKFFGRNYYLWKYKQHLKEQLGEKENASIRSQMELKIKDLKSELS